MTFVSCYSGLLDWLKGIQTNLLFYELRSDEFGGFRRKKIKFIKASEVGIKKAIKKLMFLPKKIVNSIWFNGTTNGCCQDNRFFIENLLLTKSSFLLSFLDEGRFYVCFGLVRLFIVWSTRNEHSSFILTAICEKNSLGIMFTLKLSENIRIQNGTRNIIEGKDNNRNIYRRKIHKLVLIHDSLMRSCDPRFKMYRP